MNISSFLFQLSRLQHPLTWREKTFDEAHLVHAGGKQTQSFSHDCYFFKILICDVMCKATVASLCHQEMHVCAAELGSSLRCPGLTSTYSNRQNGNI